MKILVMGIFTRKNGESDSDHDARLPKFAAASFAVGKALAERGDIIIVTVPSWQHVTQGTAVARHVVQGANEVSSGNGQKTEIVLYTPRNSEPDDDTPDIRTLPNITIHEQIMDSPLGISYKLPDVNKADVIIVVDGGAVVQAIATAADSFGKTVVPLISLGDVPKSLHDDLLRKDFDYYLEQGDISPTEVRALEANWSPERQDEGNMQNAREIVGLIKKLTALRARADAQNTRWLLITVGLTILSIATWVAVFASSWMQENTWSFFIFLFLAVWPGISLRTLVSYQNGMIVRLTGSGLLIDFGVACVIAFGLALLYLIGSIAFTGQLAVDFSKELNTDITRTAVSISILGLAAGYLVPLGRLRELLENTLAQQQK